MKIQDELPNPKDRSEGAKTWGDPEVAELSVSQTLSGAGGTTESSSSAPS